MSLAQTLSTVGSYLIEFFSFFIDCLLGDPASTGFPPEFADMAGWFELQPYFILGIVISLIFVGAKVIRKFVWGS